MGIISSLSVRPSRPGRPPLGKRGAIGVGFAVGATALLGMGALATEAGIWLAVRRNAQDAADAAAYAGTVRLSLSGASDAADAANQVVRRNGFTHTGTLTAAGDTRVQVDIGFVQPAAQTGGAVGAFVTPAPSGNSPNAVRVQIWQVQRIGLAQLISRTAPVAWGGAVATIEEGGPACTLSIPPADPAPQVEGRTNIAGSTTVTAPNCLIASNFTGRKSINIQGAAADNVTAAGLRASGQCYNCEDVPSGNLGGGYVSGAPVTPNPYAYLDQWSMPSFNNSQCVDPIYLDAAGQPTTRNKAATILLTARNDYRTNTYTAGGRTYTISRNTNVATCTDIDFNSGTLRLQPGTYFFNNASLTMNSSARITCDGCTPGGAGVTLVFTGNNANNVGTFRAEGGEFTLIAPGQNSGSPPIFDGTVIYRDDLGATGNAPRFNMKITGNPSSTLFGAIYAPSAGVEMLGTSGMNQTTAGNCIAIVAAEITFSGNSAANIDACESNGTKVARVRYVRLVQ